MKKKREMAQICYSFFSDLLYFFGGNPMAFTFFVLEDNSHEISSLIFLKKVTEFENVCYKF